MRDAWRERRNELVALAVLVVGIATVPLLSSTSVPASVYGLGVTSAAVLALHATGVVLVYRSDRFLNIAQIQIGALGGTVFALIVQADLFLRAVEAACPPCIDEVSGGVRDVNYVVAALVGVMVAVALGGLTYVAVIRRLSRASRLVLTVASIFVVQTLSGLRDPLVRALTTEDQQTIGVPAGALPPPGSISFDLGGRTFTTADLLVVAAAVVAVVGTLLYLRFTATGVAIRAAAASRDRARTLGIDVDRVTGRVWLLVGALSGVAAVISVMGGGEESVSGGLNAGLLLRVLAVAVVARLVSLPLVAVAALAFGLLDQLVLFVAGSTLPVDGALLLIVGGLLLAQRREASRSDADTGWQGALELRPIPAVLRDLPEVRRYVRVGTVVLATLLLGLPWVLSPSQTNLVTVAVIYAMVGLSLLILTGWGGLVSLGQFAFAGVAGWVVAVLGLPLPVALVVGPLAGAVLAVAVGLPALKLEGLYLAVTTLAFAVATTAIVLNPRYLGGLLPDDIDRPSFLGLDLDDQRASYYLMLALLVLATLAVVGLRRSRTGRVLIAARDNDAAVASIGISVTRARLSAFALAGFLAALAGVLFSYQQGGVRPDSFSAERSILLFVVTVIGGFGSVVGPLLGFAYFAIVSLFSTSATIVRLASGVLGLALLLAAPGGLAEIAYGMRDAMLRRVARRHRILVPSLIADQKDEDLDAHAPIRPRGSSLAAGDYVPRRYGLTNQWLIGPAETAARTAEELVVAIDDDARATDGETIDV